jgi:hypothetical protein
MRTCIGISVAIHAAFMLWLVLAPGARTLSPASAEAIMVDLVPPQETPLDAQPKSEETKSQETKSPESKSEETKSEEAKAEQPKTALPPTAPPKPEPSKLDPSKPEPSKSASSRPEPSKPESSKPEPSKPEPPPQANQKPQPKNDATTAAEERAAAAARIAWMLNLPTDTEASLAAPPSEDKSNLSKEEIADFKAQISKCWVAPDGVPSMPGFNILVRIALNPDGTLGAKPQLIRAPASDAGPPLVESAKQALQQCQPYGGLPVAKYRDWKILDLTFTAQGPYGLAGPQGRRASTKP